MSATAREVVAESLKVQFGIHPPSITAENLNNNAACQFLADCVIRRLDAAGFVIVPKDLPK